MGDNSKISWTDATWNPIRGCTPVSAGCKHCYAAGVASRISGEGQPYEGLAHDGKWTGKVRCLPELLSLPLRWKRPRRIFVNSMSDLFHPDVPNEFIAAVFGVMAACQQHTFQVLTKRPDRMRSLLNAWLGMGLSNREGMVVSAPNIWLGVSVEDQDTADERIPELLATPAAVRFVSAEPLLGTILLNESWLVSCHGCGNDGSIAYDADPGVVGRLCLDACIKRGELPSVDWVIVGGESGPRARPMHPDWVRSIRDQCVAADVPYFFKQWGEWENFYDRDKDDPDWRNCPHGEDSSRQRYLNLAGGWGFHGDRVVAVRRVGKVAAGHLLDGVEWHQWPKVKL
jgi:protein gp37